MDTLVKAILHKLLRHGYQMVWNHYDFRAFLCFLIPWSIQAVNAAENHQNAKIPTMSNFCRSLQNKTFEKTANTMNGANNETTKIKQ